MNGHVPLVKTACGKMEAVEVVGRVGDQIIVRVWNESRLNHVLQCLVSEGIKSIRVFPRERQGGRGCGGRKRQATNRPARRDKRDAVRFRSQLYL